MSQPSLQLRVFDETGAQLQSGNGFFQLSPFVPEIVFLPVAVASAALRLTRAGRLIAGGELRGWPSSLTERPPLGLPRYELFSAPATTPGARNPAPI
jgi:hypothetical protein